MKTRSASVVVLTVLSALVAALLSGCGATEVGTHQPMLLTITEVSMPDTSAAGQPVTYTATVRIENANVRFDRFGFVRGTNLYNLAAFGETGGGGATRTEVHSGTITFPNPGTYTVTFLGQDPPITKNVTIQ